MELGGLCTYCWSPAWSSELFEGEELVENTQVQKSNEKVEYLGF